MRKKLFVVLMSVVLMLSLIPTISFAGSFSDEMTFNNYKACRRVSFVEQIKTCKYADQLDISLVDATLNELDNMKYDDSKDVNGNCDAILALLNKLYEKEFAYYKAQKKLAMEVLKSGADSNVEEIVKNKEAVLDALTLDYYEENLLEDYLPAVDCVVNECILSVLNYNSPSTIKAAKITQKNPSADKKGKIKVKFGVKTVGDAKIAQYQIYRSTSKNFKKGLKKITVKISDPTQSTVTYTDSKGLKKGRKYYYKVRGVVDGKTYTKWSGIKSIKRK